MTTEGDGMFLTCDKRVHRGDKGHIIESFVLAGENGNFYKAYARNPTKGSFWEAAKTIHVWGPLAPRVTAAISSLFLTGP